MELMLGVDTAALTLKPNVFDWPPSGLLTLMVQAPGPLNVMIIWNEVAVTDWICDPLSVVPPPPGKPTATVSPLWNPEPFTVTVWLLGPAVGVEGEIELMLGEVTPATTVNVLLALNPPGS